MVRQDPSFAGFLVLQKWIGSLGAGRVWAHLDFFFNFFFWLDLQHTFLVCFFVIWFLLVGTGYLWYLLIFLKFLKFFIFRAPIGHCISIIQL